MHHPRTNAPPHYNSDYPTPQPIHHPPTLASLAFPITPPKSPTCPPSPPSPPKTKTVGHLFRFTPQHPTRIKQQRHCSASLHKAVYNSEKPFPQCRTTHPLTRFARPRPPPQKSVFFILFAFHAVFKLPPNCQISKMAIWIFDNLTKPHFPNIPNIPTMGILRISGISTLKRQKKCSQR